MTRIPVAASFGFLLTVLASPAAAEWTAGGGPESSPAPPASAPGEGATWDSPGEVPTPTPPPPPESAEEPDKLKSFDGKVHWGVDAAFRGVFAPKWFLNAVAFNESEGINNVGFSVHAFRRKGKLDLKFGITMDFHHNGDGAIFNDASPDYEAEWITSRLKFLSFNFQALWHHDLARWIAITYGIGFGVGVVIGDLEHVNTYAESDDTRVTERTPCPEWGWTGFPDNSQNQPNQCALTVYPSPYEKGYGSGKVPPVLPDAIFILGFKFRVPSFPNLEFHVEGGVNRLFFASGGFSVLF